MRQTINEAADTKDRIKIDDKTVKTICSSTQMPTEALIEVLPAASINIVEATDCPGQPHCTDRAKVDEKESKRRSWLRKMG